MDALLKMLTRTVEALEKIADALGEMNADGVAVVVTDASKPAEQDAKPAEEEETGEEETVEEETVEDDEDSLGGEDEVVIEQGDVRKAIRAYAAKHGEPKAIALMKKHAKAAKISEIKPEFFKAVHDAASV